MLTAKSLVSKLRHRNGYDLFDTWPISVLGLDEHEQRSKPATQYSEAESYKFGFPQGINNYRCHSPVVSACAPFCGRGRIAQSDFPPNPRRLGLCAPGDGLPLPPKSRTTGSAIRPVPILDCAILDRHAVLNVGSCHCRQLLGEGLLLFRWQKPYEAKDHTQQGSRTAVLDLYSRKEIGTFGRNKCNVSQNWRRPGEVRLA
jgi:hypothetical protein